MHSLNIVAPELLLVAGSIFVLLAGLWFNNKKFLITAASATLITAFFMLTHMTGKPMQDVFNGLLSFDPFGHFFSVFAVLVTLFAIWMSARSADSRAGRIEVMNGTPRNEGKEKGGWREVSPDLRFR